MVSGLTGLSNVEFVLDFDNTILNGLAFEDDFAASYFGFNSVKLFKDAVQDLGYFNWVDSNIDSIRRLFDLGYKPRLRSGFGWFLAFFSGFGVRFKIATSNLSTIVQLCMSSYGFNFDESDFVACNDGSGVNYDKGDIVLSYLFSISGGKTVFYIGDVDSDLSIFTKGFSDALDSSDVYLDEFVSGFRVVSRDPMKYTSVCFSDGSRFYVDIFGKGVLLDSALPITLHSDLSFSRFFSLHSSICDRLGLGL